MNTTQADRLAKLFARIISPAIAGRYEDRFEGLSRLVADAGKAAELMKIAEAFNEHRLSLVWAAYCDEGKAKAHAASRDRLAGITAKRPKRHRAPKRMHLTTATPAGRAERVRWWIKSGTLPFNAKALAIAAAVGISREEAIELAQERLAELETRQRADKAARLALLRAKGRSGAY